MHRLFRANRQINNPIIKQWVHWFTTEVSRKDNQLTYFPEILQLVLKIPEKTYTRQELSRPNNVSEEQFFPKLFLLDEPFSPIFPELTSLIISSQEILAKLDKVLPPLAPIFFQYLIKFMYQIEKIFQEAMNNNSCNQQKCIQDLQNLGNLYRLFAKSTSYFGEAIYLSKNLFQQLELILNEESNVPPNDMKPIISMLLNVFVSYTDHYECSTQTLIPIFNFYTIYYRFWVLKFINHPDEFDDIIISDCENIPCCFLKFKSDFAIANYKDMFYPMLQVGFNLLSFIFLDSFQISTPGKIFKLGISFLKFLHYCTDLGPEFAEAIWEHQMFHFICFFTIWSIDRFPFVSFDLYHDFDETELALMSPEFINSLDPVNVEEFEFLNVTTYKVPLVITENSLNTSIRDPDQFTRFDFNEIDGDIMKIKKLKLLITILQSFTIYPSSTMFLKIFIDVLLDFSKSYLDASNRSTKMLSMPELLSASITYFVIQFLLSIDIKKVSYSLASFGGFEKLIKNFAFDQKHNMWTTKQDSGYLGFFCLLRTTIYQLFAQCFINDPENSPKVLTAVSYIFQDSTPQMADEAVKFLSTLFRAYPDAFVSAISVSQAKTIIVNYVLKLQSMQLRLISDNINPTFLFNVDQSSIQILNCVDLFLRDDKARCFLFCIQSFVKMLFHLLFDKMVQTFSLNLIKRGLLLDSGSFDPKLQKTPFDHLFPLIESLFQKASAHKDDIRWIELILSFLQMNAEILQLNRQSVLPYIDKFNYMEEIAVLPEIASDFENHMKIVNCVLRCYVPITEANLQMRKRVAKYPMIEIQKAIAGLPFGEETINILLRLLFEQQISISNLPKSAEIHNQKILPYLHAATQHLPEHTKIFCFISKICSPSVTNKLKVFRSKMLICIIKYIESFPSNSSTSLEQQKSINALLTLFSTVSSFVFHWKTFYECIRSMRITNKGYRAWWTSILISCFTNILSSISRESPSSFFHFDGRHSGIYLPKIDSSFICNKFSFVVRFELGAFWGLPHTKPCLLCLVTTANQRFELYFDNKKLVLEYKRSEKGQLLEFRPDYEFKSNHWYHLVVTVDNTCICFYIDGKISNQFQLKRSLKFSQSINDGVIGNISKSKIAASESPLIFNLSCVYLFNTSLSSSSIYSMSLLPLDFVYNFSPSTATLYKELPSECSQLFTEANESNLLFCFNARMTVGNVCANLAQNSISNATVKGQIIPFSTTFCDVTTNVGGLKTFLPLFEQVDLPILNESNNDSSNFLHSLIGLFSRFCASSDIIQADFVHVDGFKCLASLLLKIKPETFSRRIINQLLDFYSELNCAEYKSMMIRDFWFNFTLWQHTPPEIQIFVINHYCKTLFPQDSPLVVSATSVKSIIMLISDEKNVQIRQAYWKFILTIANLQFTIEDQKCLFTFAFLDLAVDLQLEALSNMYTLMSKKIGNFHKIIELYGFYNEFIGLFSSPFEKVRLFGLDFLTLIFSFEIANEVKIPSNQFNQAFLTVISGFNPHNGTIDMWNAVLTYFFDYSKPVQQHIFPFICFLSTFYELDTVRKFIHDVNERINPNDLQSPLCVALSSIQIWYYWLFHLMLQANRPELVFDQDIEIIEIYAKLCASVIIRNTKNNSFFDVIAYLHSFEITKKWDISSLVRNILIKVMEYLKKNVTEVILAVVVKEVFCYLFYIPSTEPFYYNSQLMSLHETEFINPLSGSTQGHTALKIPEEKIQVPNNYSFNFSARIIPDGKWLDIDLAFALLSFIETMITPPSTNETETRKNYDISFQIFDNYHYYDIYSFILYYIVRSEPENFDPYQFFMKRYHNKAYFHSQEVYFFAHAFYHVSIKNKNYSQFDEFIINFRSYFGKIISSSSDTFFTTPIISDFFELTKDIIGNLFILISSKANSYKEQLVSTFANLPIKDNIGRIQNKLTSHLQEFTDIFKNEHETFMTEVQRLRLICEKANRRVFRDLLSNGGPWCISAKVEHWKLWPIYDQKFRRIFLKPNLKFENHMMASLMRDGSTAENAQVKYEKWLDAQDIPPTKIDEEIIDIDIENSQKDCLFSTQSQLIMIDSQVEGNFFIYKEEICFDGTESKSVQFPLSSIYMVLHRSYLHFDYGLEFFLTNQKSYFFFFKKGNRSKILQLIKNSSCPNLKLLQLTSSRECIIPFTEKWKNGLLSNYEYLMYCNLIGGRSFNDLSQYPVFPWVLSNYSSENLDLNDKNNYRDLSKPIGALNPKRLSNLIENYELCTDSPEKCLYRLHYSNAFYVVHYLARLEPYTTLHIKMQDKKFDKPNRMFWNIERSYNAVTSQSNDFRELIPEFFTLPDFLVNENHFDLGFHKELNVKIDDVVLPPWAHNPDEFINIHRKALESVYVSEHINEWIDLIFGYAQSGEASIKMNNTFHSYCYQSSFAKYNATPDKTELIKQIQILASNVGIIPRQLFTTPHPKRQFYLASITKLKTSNIFHQLLTLPFNICYLAYADNMLYMLQNDLQFTSMHLPKTFKTSQFQPSFTTLGSVSKYLLISSKGNIPTKSLTLLKEPTRFITSSLWDNSFHVFKVEANTINHCYYQRQKYSLISGLCSAGGSYLLTSWRNSSLTLWNISQADKMKQPLYRSTPHLTTLVDFDANQNLQMVASLDKNKQLVLSTLSTGRYIRAIDVDVPGIVQKVMLLDIGYIIVASSVQTPGSETTIRIYNVNTKFLKEKKFNYTILHWCKVELINGFTGIGIVFDNGHFTFLEVASLDQLIDLDLYTKIISLIFVPQHMVFFLADSSNIFSIDLQNELSTNIVPNEPTN